MRVQSTTNTNFGMAVKATPEAKEYLAERLSRRAAGKLEKLTEFAKKDAIDVNIKTKKSYLSWIGHEGSTYDQLVITTGDGAYTYQPEGYSLSIISCIKRAVRRAHRLSEK